MKDSTSSPHILSEKQRKFLGFVACFAGTLLLGCLFAAVILILNRTFDLFGGVIWSLAISGMLAILLRPIVSFFEEKAHVLKASFADKTASLTSSFEPKDISAQTSSVAGFIT